jgi:hypothetical protein
MLALTTWALVLPLVGCYRYVPVATGVMPSLGEGTIILTADGTSAVKQKLGDNIREIDGMILRVSRDSITVAVSQSTTTTRERFTQNGDTITVATSRVEQVQQKTFSRKRTVILLGAIVAVIAATLGFSAVAGASGTGDGGGGIQP